MERLMIKCSGCGDAFTLADKDGALFMDFRRWRANLDSFLNQHWEHNPGKTASQAFTLEDNESMKEAG
jgi:hypothetical protein